MGDCRGVVAASVVAVVVSDLGFICVVGVSGAGGSGSGGGGAVVVVGTFWYVWFNDQSLSMPLKLFP